MGFRVRIGRLEIECESADDLDALVTRYGGDAAPGSKQATPSTNGRDRDQILLRQLMQSGEAGLGAGTVSNLLGGARGRAVPIAVKQWAVRVGLADSEDNEVLVGARQSGGRRGWRLSAGALGAARAMLADAGASG